MTFEELTNEEKDALIAKVELESNNGIALQYLKDTDWYEIRAISGKPVPEDILTKRQEARDSIVVNN